MSPALVATSAARSPVASGRLSPHAVGVLVLSLLVAWRVAFADVLMRSLFRIRRPILGWNLVNASARAISYDRGQYPFELVSGPHYDRLRLHAAYDGVRRSVDFVIAVLGLVLLLPALVAAAVAISLDSPGPPLYFQERVGRYGRPFRMVKLRTMGADAEADGRAVWARSQDPRVTRLGAWLRRYHFDEIPQLWNVLSGDMGLVGPRPERPEFVALLTSHLPLYRTRHVVRPGITGWAQVQFKYAASVGEASIKLQYDLYYLRHRSAILDAAIMAKTLLVVLRSQGV